MSKQASLSLSLSLPTAAGDALIEAKTSDDRVPFALAPVHRIATALVSHGERDTERETWG